MFRKIGSFAARCPVPIILVFVLISIIFAIQIPNVEIDASIKGLLPDDVPAQLSLNRIEEQFGGTDMVLIGLQADDVLNKNTLKRIEDITSDLEELEGIDKVLSLSNIKNIHGDEFSLEVDPFYDELPETHNDREDLRTSLLDNGLFTGLVYSEDFTTAAVVGFLEETASDEVLLDGIDIIIKNHPGNEKILRAGLPIIRAEVSKRMKTDMARFMPIGLLIMLLFLFFSFRDIRGVILPFIVVIFSIMFAMGSLVLIGWKLQLITILLPVILIAIANDYGIHIIAQYQKLVLKHPGPWGKSEKIELIEDLVSTLGGPVFWAGITTIVGFLTLITHFVTAARNLGVLASLGITYALLGSLLFIPALLSLLPPPKKLVSSKEGKLQGEKYLENLSVYISKHSGKILIITFIVLAALAAGIPRLVVDTNPLEFFPHNSDLYQADLIIQDKMGGTATLNLVAEGDILSPEILNAMDELESKLSDREDLTKTNSITTVLKQIRQVMHGGDINEYKIPLTKEEASQYLLLYSFSGEPEDLERMIDFNYEHALITLKIRESSSAVIDKEVKNVELLLSNWKDNPFSDVGGYALILRDLTTALVHGQVKSLFLALGLIIVLLAILFKSIKTGLLSGIPLVMALIGVFGFMGWTGITLSTVTTMLTSLLIGVGVDYTIHFLWDYKSARKSNLKHSEAVKHGLTQVGRGIIINALSVIIGFLVLIISGFLPIRFFGYLITVSILFCLLGALVVLPAIIIKLSSKIKGEIV